MAIRHTDVLVVGGELAGAVAAALCARAGRRVVIIDDDEALDMVAGGVVVPPPDDLCPLLEGLAHAMAPLEVLGQRQDFKRLLPVVESGLQVLHARHRLDLCPDEARRAAELHREAGDDGDRAAATFAEKDPVAAAMQTIADANDPLAADGFFAGRRARAAWKGTFGSAGAPRRLALSDDVTWLRETLRGALPFLSASQEVPPGVQDRLLAALLAGLHVGPLGYRRTLRNQLLEAARQRGTEVIPDEHAAAFVVDGGRISEVRLSGRSSALSSRVVIDATLSRDVRDRISPEKHARKLDAAMDQARPERVRAGISWVVRRQGVPPGLGPRALLAADGEGPGSEVALLSCLRAPLHEETRKPNAALAVISGSVPCEPSHLAAALGRLQARMEQLLPFTRAHLVAEMRTTVESMPLAPTLYAGPSDASALGGRGTDGGLKNFFRAGRDVAPVLGVEGELWAGHAVATRVERVLSKRPLFGGMGHEAPQGMR